MIAIIPALLNTSDDVARLATTLGKLPRASVNRCVIVAQGLNPDIPRTLDSPTSTVLHRATSLTKWGAIALARSAIASDADNVLLVDADDPFDAGSLEHFCKVAAASSSDCLIGRRNHVTLFAEDEKSPHTRLFIEVFSNSLLLGRLGALPSITHGPDIQSGLYALSNLAFKRARFDFVRAYGGELALYYHLTTSGARVTETAVNPNHVRVSSYRAKEILRDILRLPFFSDLTEREIEAALAVGPSIYSKLIPASARRSYVKELRELLTETVQG
jgi:hypothetical protein